MKLGEVFVHEKAICESATIGPGSRVWAFAHILPHARIGSDCNICDGVFIENDVVVGDRVTVKCGVQLWDGTRIGNGVFIGPNATFTNDRYPRSKIYPEKFSGIEIADEASIGANATILPGVKIGMRAMIGAGAVVTKDVPAFAIVMGNPARIRGYVSDERTRLLDSAVDLRLSPGQANPGPVILKSGTSVYRLPEVVDLRGALSFAEVSQYLPFTVERYFIVYSVPTEEVRGEHAHRTCHQFLVCVKGSVSVIVDDGKHREQVTLNSPTLGLHIPPLVWGIQYKYSADAVLLVLASHRYAASDYIRNYSEFIDTVGVRV